MNKTLTKHEERLKRLTFRSWHRGWKETDLILGGFADTRLGQLDSPQLDIYEQLLDLDDDVIWSWIIGKETPPEEFSALVGMLQAHTVVN